MIYADFVVTAPICVYHAQMGAYFKACDVYQAVGYTRNQFRGLLQEIQFWPNGAKTLQRVARTYTELEFLVLVIACELDRVYALKRSAIADLCPLIGQELTGPRAVAKQPKLLLTVVPPSAKYIDGVPEVESGFVVSLAGVFALVDGLDTKGDGTFELVQANLNFGPGLISAKSDTAARAARTVKARA